MSGGQGSLPSIVIRESDLVEVSRSIRIKMDVVPGLIAYAMSSNTTKIEVLANTTYGRATLSFRYILDIDDLQTHGRVKNIRCVERQRAIDLDKLRIVREKRRQQQLMIARNADIQVATQVERFDAITDRHNARADVFNNPQVVDAVNRFNDARTRTNNIRRELVSNRGSTVGSSINGNVTPRSSTTSVDGDTTNSVENISRAYFEVRMNPVRRHEEDSNMCPICFQVWDDQEVPFARWKECGHEVCGTCAAILCARAEETKCQMCRCIVTGYLCEGQYANASMPPATGNTSGP